MTRTGERKFEVSTTVSQLRETAWQLRANIPIAMVNQNVGRGELPSTSGGGHGSKHARWTHRSSIGCRIMSQFSTLKIMRVACIDETASNIRSDARLHDFIAEVESFDDVDKPCNI